jgi:hypothetical protein
VIRTVGHPCGYACDTSALQETNAQVSLRGVGHAQNGIRTGRNPGSRSALFESPNKHIYGEIVDMTLEREARRNPDR